MPRFFFDTDNGSERLIDLEGRELPDNAAARWAGLETLPDMVRDKIAEGDHRTFSVVIRNAEQVVIYTATLVLMGGWRNHRSRSRRGISIVVRLSRAIPKQTRTLTGP
ncbi:MULTISPECIES: hypothetical protein [Hyphomicrobiales]|uniref:DUF6894 family protein n=1 Tax=Methylobacterium sp. CCH7-A2 TaxID=1768789 RepID=UPI0008325EFC|nr:MULTISPECIES: hypothetical protein [Hyphomicrobiales]